MDLACNNNHFYSITLLLYLDEKLFGRYESHPMSKLSNSFASSGKFVRKYAYSPLFPLQITV
jgi:hypothetical protein